MPISWTIRSDDEGLRVDKFLRRELPTVPLSHLHKLLRKRKVRLNDRRAQGPDRLKEGDRLVVRGDPERLQTEPEGGSAATSRRDFEVLHTDPDLLVVTKPAGLAIHPGTGITGSTLVDQVRAYFEAEGADEAGPMAPEEEGGVGFRPSPAHRLDRETSGLVLVARTRKAMVALTEAFTERTVKKAYLALVKGRMPQDRGKIDLPLAEHEQTKRSKDARGTNYQRALTEWRRLGAAGDYTLLLLEPRTGRTHQLRRHLAAIAHPIVGDRRHGDFPFNREAKVKLGVKRQLLHAHRLVLAHPISGEELDLRAPLPEDFVGVLEALGIAFDPAVID
ncbi:MAG: RluA family pseudouridine synthase [Deltaproteobacteria bacterium]|nr:RluA family pseudouridine synthase [Deltaproteobacteria bacterium]